MAERSELAQDIHTGRQTHDGLVILLAQIDIEIDFHAAADLVVGAGGLSFDMAQFLTLQDFDGGRNSTLNGPTFSTMVAE